MHQEDDGLGREASRYALLECAACVGNGITASNIVSIVDCLCRNPVPYAGEKVPPQNPPIYLGDSPRVLRSQASMLESSGNQYAGGDTPKLRTACENCRQSKVKCNLSGKNVCTRCLRHGLQCQYGFANRSGKPKGSKNRATLRKLGQLQEEKPPMRGYRGSRIVPPVTEREPLVAGGYSGHLADTMEDVCLISGPPGVWESPRSLGNGVMLDVPICPSQLTMAEDSPYFDLMDTSPTFPIGLGYPHTPVTPTFIPSDPLTDGITSPSFGSGSVASPYPAAPCDCVDMQLFHANRLNHLLAESMPLRFDHSLQSIKLTLGACRMFFQCGKCAKDSTNLFLVISVLNLILQLFEHWIPRGTSRGHRAEHGLELRYGFYEICQEENRQIRTFLLRGLLLQCQEVLSILKTFLGAACHEVTEPGDIEGSSENSTGSEEASSQAWMLPDIPQMSLPRLNSEVAGSAPEDNCLRPIIAGHEATIEAFLQSISMNECICGSKPALKGENN